MRIIFAIGFVFVTTLTIVSQTANKSKKVEFPNELKGFELMKEPKFKSLITTIRISKDWKEIEKSLPDKCSGSCKLNNNWKISLLENEPIGTNNFSIQFYPLKRISLSKIKFPKQFRLNKMESYYQGKITHLLSFIDKFGLRYIVLDEDKDNYRKGDLYFIEYGLSEDELKWMRW